MDKLDIEIIKLLLKDAQMPFRQIAQQLGKGTDTIIRRYSQLKKEGVIQKASIIINMKKCGFTGMCSFLINLRTGANAPVVFDKLSQIPNVVVVASTLGDYEFMVFSMFSDTADFGDLHDEIAKIDAIENIEICFSPKFMPPTFPSTKYYFKAVSNGQASNPE